LLRRSTKEQQAGLEPPWGDAVLQKISGRGDAIIESENDLLFISAFSGAYELKLQPPRKRVITADYFCEPRFVRYFLHIGALCV
jgi:hypothetical protein